MATPTHRTGPDDPPRVLVTGSRTWTDYRTLATGLRDAAAGWPDLVIVHGACPAGADALADLWCRRHGVPVERWPADWTRHGRAAGHRRNADMVTAGALLCLAFIRDASPGASTCAALAHDAGIPIRYYLADTNRRDALPTLGPVTTSTLREAR